MNLQAEYKHMPEEQKVLIRLAAGGCVRTRRDAEDFCHKIEARGWQRELVEVYRAALALLRDPAAFAGLSRLDFFMAKGCLERMRKFYADDKSCKCIRGSRQQILAAMPHCPIHRGKQPV